MLTDYEMEAIPLFFAATVRHLTAAADTQKAHSNLLWRAGLVCWVISLAAQLARPDSGVAAPLGFLGVALFVLSFNALDTARQTQRHAADLNLRLAEFKSCGDLVQHRLR